MKMLLARFLGWFLRGIISLRYQVHVHGLEAVSKNLPKDKGILFLPNHPAVFVDPAIVVLSLLKKFQARPVMVEYMYYLPVVNTIMRLIRAVPIPNFSVSSNSHKIRRMEKALQAVSDGLKNKESFVFYPAGRIKGTMKEQIGGTSGLLQILEQAGDVSVVLVRTTGLWGSHFSRAYSSKTPHTDETLWMAFKITLKNLIFFNPRRRVDITFEELPKDFPLNGTKLEVNQALEEWYNREPDVLKKVPYSRFGKEPVWPEEKLREKITLNEVHSVAPEIKDKVYAKLSEISGMPASGIQEEMNLSTDLGIDSLNTAEISLFLEEAFDVRELSGEELIKVSDVLGFASKDLLPLPEEELPKDLKKWLRSVPKKLCSFKGGSTIVEAFLKVADLDPKRVIVADAVAGSLTYRDLKTRVALLRDIFAKMPGEHIGILLPGSVTALVCILACLAAKKVPVMVNWTLGPRHIESIMTLTSMETAITAWSFLDRLAHVDLGRLTDKLVQLEDLRKEITWKQKLKALFSSYSAPKTLLKKWRLTDVAKDDRAIVLFTSGSEGVPKGVPLSHHNILSNIQSMNDSVQLFEDDVMISILPPFHSYGLTVSAIAGPLLGIRTAFFPNPNEAHKIAKGVEYYQGTLLCGAPTFLRRILKAAKPPNLKTLRLLVTGAEKAPKELYDLAETFGLAKGLIEGYGITECSPVLTINRPDEEHFGVGRPAVGVEIEVIHLETHEPVSAGQSGLVLARGENVFSGYLNPSISSPFITYQGKVWYKTGDIGYLDEKGRLVIVGRLKRFIKVGGEMISLAGLEEALMESYPESGASEGPTFAVTSKNSDGDRPKVILFSTLPVTLEEANHALKKSGFSNLARFTSVHTLPELPILGTGKVDYKKLEGDFLH